MAATGCLLCLTAMDESADKVGKAPLDWLDPDLDFWPEAEISMNSFSWLEQGEAQRGDVEEDKADFIEPEALTNAGNQANGKGLQRHQVGETSTSRSSLFASGP